MDQALEPRGDNTLQGFQAKVEIFEDGLPPGGRFIERLFTKKKFEFLCWETMERWWLLKSLR